MGKYKDPQYPAKWRKANRIKCRAYAKTYADGLRMTLLLALGGKCVNCGFSDVRALQVDHINGGGNKDRSLMSANMSSKKVARKIAQYHNGLLQLLCANCNWIKRVENNECRKVTRDL